MKFIVYRTEDKIEKVKLRLLENELFVPNWSAQKIFRNQWQHEVFKIAVAYTSRYKPVAWVMDLTCSYFGDTTWAYTAPQYRRKGIGSRLVSLIGTLEGRYIDRGLPYQEYFWEKCEQQLQETGMMVS